MTSLRVTLNLRWVNGCAGHICGVAAVLVQQQLSTQPRIGLRDMEILGLKRRG